MTNLLKWKQAVDESTNLGEKREMKDYVQYKIREEEKSQSLLQEVTAEQRAADIKKYLDGGLLSTEQVQGILNSYKKEK
jgi:hypothetical protein